MTTLQELREIIDVIDKQIVELYEQRMELCEQVADIKLSIGKEIFDQQRELEKLQSVEACCKDEKNRKGIRALFQHIMTLSKEVQCKYMENKEKSIS